jgi:hypothetical protein
MAAKKVMRVLGMVRRTFQNLDETTLKILYCSVVRPHLEYCLGMGSISEEGYCNTGESAT